MKIDQSYEVLTLRETQIALLNLLHKVDIFLKKHKLKYFLAYGTALGAVRHHGFIPWDDDLDIYMMREDYEKLIDLLKKSKTDFDFFEFRNSKNYFYPFMKICDPTILLKEPHAKNSMNLNVDVFPLDYVPDNKDELRVIHKKIMRLRTLTAFKTNRIFYIPTRWKKSKKIVFLPIFFAANLLMSMISQKALVNRYQRIFEKLNTKTNTLLDLAWGKLRETMDPSIVNESLIIKFEDGEFPIMKDYDFYLKLIYNDYMNIPNKNEQFTHKSKNYRKK